MASAAATRTSYRLEPKLKAGLEQLSALTKTSQNDLVNEAVREFVEKRSTELAAYYEELARQLKAYKKSDPEFSKAIAATVAAETSGNKDPVEGTAFVGEIPAEYRKKG